jgi:rubrerythrin
VGEEAIEPTAERVANHRAKPGRWHGSGVGNRRKQRQSMQNTETNLTDGLSKAIQAERDGYAFYQMAANSSEDPKAKEMFAQLADEELDHMRFLVKQRESVLKAGKPDPSAKLGPRAELSGLSPIFSDGIKARIATAHIEMSALSIGIQLELDSISFYKSQSEAADDAEVGKFYAELAEWESGHYQALLRQQEELKEDYWSANRFAAF